MKALIIFARTPVKGKVKTRLKPYLSPGKILRLYRSFIKDTVSACARIKGADRLMGCTPSMDDPFFDELSGACNLKRFNQKGETLKDRIVNAFEDHFKLGYKEIVLIGSDSPTMPPEYIRKAFSELKKNDLVIGPCFDGGLYLIGARRNKLRGVFRNIRLGTGEDVTVLLGKISRLNIRAFLLPFWYDVDTVEDLRFFRNHVKYLEGKRTGS
ncbi:MAG TPA: glycosyltransferase [Nitrospirae bacterium]|nr:2-phospho-L-lactate guanylyltransferase [bacterium BMS3Abin10]GBE38001.1 2-phospho-L-lactate guanylyltransferase [bacterium BMS3Bbin08]HDH51278.1 glycosyltransferase [Nitrospirota bacterium]HDK16902.1 glycosyltransferase [Nitrospirota bacterium]HDK81540.1 glycosyltransferase [Nitrospirota bacterium]